MHFSKTIATLTLASIMLPTVTVAAPRAFPVNRLTNQALPTQDGRVITATNVEQAKTIIGSRIESEIVRLNTRLAELATSSADQTITQRVSSDITADIAFLMDQKNALATATEVTEVSAVIDALKSHSIDRRSSIQDRRETLMKPAVAARMARVQAITTSISERYQAAITTLQAAGIDTIALEHALAEFTTAAKILALQNTDATSGMRGSFAQLKEKSTALQAALRDTLTAMQSQ